MTAQEIIQQMWDADHFSQWLGISREIVEEGSCILSMKVRPEMVNGFGIAHGAIAYALADSALAFASNSRGNTALSIETSMSHILPINIGDTITASSIEKHVGRKLAIYEIQVHNQLGELVALFKGTVYFRKKE